MRVEWPARTDNGQKIATHSIFDSVSNEMFVSKIEKGYSH